MTLVRTGAVLMASSVGALIAGGSAHARSTINVSLAPPPPEPRLQRPFTFAAVPSSPLLFAIPATGQALLELSASGLPGGLSVTPVRGHRLSLVRAGSTHR